MQLIRSDDTVAVLNSPAVAMLESVLKQFEFEEQVYLFESLHGHIAKFTKRDGRFISALKKDPERLCAEDLMFFAKLDGFRWVEASHGQLSIGFTNMDS